MGLSCRVFSGLIKVGVRFPVNGFLLIKRLDGSPIVYCIAAQTGSVFK